jgi:hypothetical protein
VFFAAALLVDNEEPTLKAAVIAAGPVALYYVLALVVLPSQFQRFAGAARAAGRGGAGRGGAGRGGAGRGGAGRGGAGRGGAPARGLRGGPRGQRRELLRAPEESGRRVRAQSPGADAWAPRASRSPAC